MRTKIETTFSIGDCVFAIANNEIKFCMIFEIIVRENISVMQYPPNRIKIFYNVSDIDGDTYIVEEEHTAMNEEYLQEILDKGV